MITVSKRLERIAYYIPTGSRLADIGSDHAFLPLYLSERNMIKSAIAGEVHRGPFQAAQRNVAAAKFTAEIHVRLGDGLDVIQHGEVDVISIAGMGGSLIASILERGKHKLKGITRLVLQPNVGEEVLRRWLYENGWTLIDEEIIEEDGKIYEIICAEPVQESERDSLYQEPLQLDCGLTLLRDELFLFGPLLVRKPTLPFLNKWKREQEKLQKIVKRLAQAKVEDAASKRENFLKQLHRISEVLQCLRKEQQ